MIKSLLKVGLMFLASLGWGQSVVHSAGREVPNVFLAKNQFTQGIVAGPVIVSQLANLDPATTLIFAIDATLGSNPCAGGGTGALAIRINNAWNCAGGSGGGGGGSVTSITGSSPILLTPNPIIGIGTISCPTCVTGSGTPGQVAYFSGSSAIGGWAGFNFANGGGFDLLSLGNNATQSGALCLVNQPNVSQRCISSDPAVGGAVIVSGGTIVVKATSPLALDTTSGAVSCPTCSNIPITITNPIAGQGLIINSVPAIVNTFLGVPINAQTGTTFSPNPIPATVNTNFVTGCNASPTTWAGPVLANNMVFTFENICSGLITFTPNTGLVNGAATQIIPQNWFGYHYIDNGSIYTRMPIMPTLQAFPDCPNTGGNRLNFTLAIGQLACGLQTKVLFVTAGLSFTGTTSYVAIPDLSFTLAANQAVVLSEDCDLLYSQSTAVTSDYVGIQDASVAPTNINAQGSVQTASAGSAIEGNLTGLTTTTATPIVSFTPGVIGTIYNARLHILVEHPSNASTSVLSVGFRSSVAGDGMTVYRGSKCVVNFQ